MSQLVLETKTGFKQIMQRSKLKRIVDIYFSFQLGFFIISI